MRKALWNESQFEDTFTKSFYSFIHLPLTATKWNVNDSEKSRVAWCSHDAGPWQGLRVCCSAFVFPKKCYENSSEESTSFSMSSNTITRRDALWMEAKKKPPSKRQAEHNRLWKLHVRRTTHQWATRWKYWIRLVNQVKLFLRFWWGLFWNYVTLILRNLKTSST